MSDRVEELSRKFAENVLEQNARSVGLFPIPEYPELEERGMWSTVLNIFLTSLRYLAPATLLTLFWVQPNCLLKLLKYIDSAVKSLVFSSEEQKEDILQWLADAGPVRVDSLDVVWRQGWIVCGVLDMALPGACAGHPPSRLSLTHAQSVAEHYLGVEPVFTRQELEIYDSLSKHQEYKLINFLESIRQALSKLTPPTVKQTTTTSHKNISECLQNTLDYIAKGSGLTAVQINNKVYFKIYPTAQQSMDPGEIAITIQGPKGICGKTFLPPILGKAQLIRQTLLGQQSKSNFTESVLPITQGTTYMRSYGKNYINKTFYIPKTKHDIEIEAEVKQDHARVSYTATIEGKYEISITSKGQNIVGSPFIATASNNIISILEKDNFCLEDGEEINIVDIKNDKKVVLRIVDYGTEKMILRENGALEKISEEDAKMLIESNKKRLCNNNIISTQDKTTNSFLHHKEGSEKFYRMAHKVLIMNSVCRALHNFKEQTALTRKISSPRAKQGVPDIVNSTFYDDQISHTMQEKKKRIIISESISVSILTEKPKIYIDDVEIVDAPKSNIQYPKDGLENIRKFKDDLFEDDNVSVETTQSSSNPFLIDMYDQNYEVEKAFGSFVPNEYETNNSQSEETEDSMIKLLDNNNSNTNPFFDSDNVNFDRSNTDVASTASRDIQKRIDSVGPHSKVGIVAEDIIRSNLKNNPFIVQERNLAHLNNDRPDFIIGAPVSIPPIILSQSNEHKSNPDFTERKCKYSKEKLKENLNPTIIHKPLDQVDGVSRNSNFDSLDSNNSSKMTLLETSREMSPKTDIWDSAYVSIDENICAESTSSESSNDKMYSIEKPNLPTRANLRDIKYIDEDHEISKCEIKRTEITPIIEENEKSISFGMKDTTSETNPVMTTFTELDDIYDDIFSNSEVSSETTIQEYKFQNVGIDCTAENDEVCVNSASDILTDVKRQTKQREGKISEVQENVTESVSVSHNLHVKERYDEENNNLIDNETQFGDQRFVNIVSEKKKYWDERIREIEAKSEEIRILQSKRRLSSKHLRRNDSLTKRRGKKIVEHFLKSGQEEYEKYVKDRSESFCDDIQQIETFDNFEKQNIEISKDEKLSCFGKKSSESKANSVIDTLKQIKVSSEDLVDIVTSNEEPKTDLNLKQELSEKVFQAFETSPKRFFGTSRKHILNKIDTFLGLPNNEQETKKSKIDVNHESGLVSSRISLYHNISNTEELPWTRRKSKSMYNLSCDEHNKSLKVHQEIKAVPTNVTQSHADCHTESKRSHHLENSVINACNEPTKENYKILNQRRAKMTPNTYSISFDESTSQCVNDSFHNVNTNSYVKKTINDLNKQNYTSKINSSVNKLKSISKSEMDIFNRISNISENDGLDKHKSYEELPKICVKNFISHYEDVSKTSNPTKKSNKLNPAGSTQKLQVQDSFPDTSRSTKIVPADVLTSKKSRSPHIEQTKTAATTNETVQMFEKLETKDKNITTTTNVQETVIQDSTYLSLSDIDLEIIENEVEKPVDTAPQPEAEIAHLEYKNRFSMAKKYFQSLEELREGTRKNNTKKSLHSSTSVESFEDNNHRPKKKSNIKKSRSMPSSEIAKIWNQMQEHNATENTKKFVKISEKFHVEDLFEDVMEGRLSRQGSLRGIPHKKAVLETFRSMENISDNKLNSYEMAVEQLNDFAKENHVRNAQTYLSEYPYLPMTDPSKYHSRLDTTASGLITFKELKTIPRRNSVPDLRLNPTFTADL